MKKIFLLLACCFCVSFGSTGHAATGHYVSGTEGIKAATLPPPGFYWRSYNLFYNAGKMNDNKGKKISPNFDVSVYAMANRFIYSSEITILGANLLIDAIIPLVYTDISLKGAGPGSFSDNKFGIGDIIVEPFALGWHGERYDAAFALGLYMPTGEYNKNRPASPGKGFWTGMLSVGGTLYMDEAKTWSASLLARYEVHSKQEDTHHTPGNDFHFEWGVGKLLGGAVDVGVAGYSRWQVTDNSGSGTSQYKEQAHAIGPEIAFPIPALGMHVSVRSLWEFETKNLPQGNMTTLTLTRRF